MHDNKAAAQTDTRLIKSLQVSASHTRRCMQDFVIKVEP